MSDYIKREDALNTFSNAFYSGLAAKIKSIPPADVVPVRHGRWEIETHFTLNGGVQADAKCSICGNGIKNVFSAHFVDTPEDIMVETVRRYAENEPKPNFCDRCGADMRGGAKMDGEDDD